MNVFRPPVMKGEEDDSSSARRKKEEKRTAERADDDKAAEEADGGGAQQYAGQLSECPVCMEPYDVGADGHGEEDAMTKALMMVTNAESGGESPTAARLPYLLHCGHSFCRQCLEGCAAAEREKANASSTSLRSSLFGSLLSPFTASSSAIRRRTPLGWMRDAGQEGADGPLAAGAARFGSARQRVTVMCPICRLRTPYDSSKGPVGGLSKNYELISAIRIIRNLLARSQHGEERVSESRKRKANHIEQDDEVEVDRSEDEEAIGLGKVTRTGVTERTGHRGLPRRPRSEKSDKRSRNVDPMSPAWGTLVITDRGVTNETMIGEDSAKLSSPKRGRSHSASSIACVGENRSSPRTSPTAVPRSKSLLQRRASSSSPKLENSPIQMSLSDPGVVEGDDPFLPTAPPEYLFDDSRTDLASPSTSTSSSSSSESESASAKRTTSPSSLSHVVQTVEEADSEFAPSAPPLPFPSHLFHYPSSPFHTSSPSHSFEFASADTSLLPSNSDTPHLGDSLEASNIAEHVDNHAEASSSNQAGEIKWVDMRDDCKRCRKPFGLLVRHRRCHYCGDLFCYRCCWQFSRMPTVFGYRRRQRTCIDCSHFLHSSSSSNTTSMELDQQVDVDATSEPSASSMVSPQIGREWPSFELDSKLAAVYDLSCKAVNVGVGALALAKGEADDPEASESTKLWGGYHAWHFLASKKTQWEEEMKLRQEEEMITRSRLLSSPRSPAPERSRTQDPSP